jgi:hypothetical protein
LVFVTDNEHISIAAASKRKADRATYAAVGNAMFSVRAFDLGRRPKVVNQVERFTKVDFALPRFGLSKILFPLLRNLRNVGYISNSIIMILMYFNS